ncbi:MAG: 3-phosphoglycerate dehydrogenase family protein [Emergencia sp.]|nr:3-phosphoglycerate dehydrogenase family protein [Emergencia sp.]
MYKIGTLNKISQTGLACFSDKYAVSDDVAGANGILVRSQDMHEMEFGRELLSIARAGAGVNNIPLDRCAEEGIVVFNTPGANANAVKELVLAGMLLAARNIPAGIAWANTLTENIGKAVEKGKSQFAGTELRGKTLGVVGLGAIGVLVANAACDLGMKVIGYDPYFSIKSAHSLYSCVDVKNDIKALLPLCDYISIHVPAMDSTKGMFNAELFGLMKDNAVLLNFSRDKLVNEPDLLAALAEGKPAKYVTDFPTDNVLGKDGVICLPHLGASTAEAEDNCASMAALQTMDYIENGNIVNSVNFPAVSLGERTADNRICVLTKGEPNPLKLASAMFSDINIKAVAGNVRGEYGYALISTDEQITSVPKVDGVIKVRVIQPDEA